MFLFLRPYKHPELFEELAGKLEFESELNRVWPLRRFAFQDEAWAAGG